MYKRIFDVILSFFGLIILTPILIIISILIIMDSGWPIFYLAKRIGQNESEFTIIKFRTMKRSSDNFAITISDKDPRITSLGYILRKLKIDEFPQLINVLIGNMSFVGPRPDVKEYKNYYKELFPKYFQLKPGITSYSSIHFANESKLYENVDDPEKVYINKTIPKKVELDKKYYYKRSLVTDLEIIFKTFKNICFQKGNNNMLH